MSECALGYDNKADQLMAKETVEKCIGCYRANRYPGCPVYNVLVKRVPR